MLHVRLFLLLLGASLAMSGCAATPDSSPSALFGAYMRDTAAHDLDAAMAHLAPDMEAEFSPEYVVPREEMRRILSFDFAVNSRTEYTVMSETDDTIEVEMVENNDLLNLLGVHDMQVRLRVSFRDDKIVRQTMLDLAFSGPTIEEAMAPFLAWAQENAPERFSLIHGEAGPIYTGESAPVWLTLAREWRSARSP